MKRPARIVLMAAVPVLIMGAVGGVLIADLVDQRRISAATDDARAAGLPGQMELDLGLEACTSWDGVLCGWADVPAEEAAVATAAHLRDNGVAVGEVVCGADVAVEPYRWGFAVDCAAHGADLRTRGEARVVVTASDTIPQLGVPRGRTIVTVGWSALGLESRDRERLDLPAASAHQLEPTGAGLDDVASALPARWRDLADESFGGVPLYEGPVDVDGLGDGIDEVVAALVLEMTSHGLEVTGGRVDGGVDLVGNRLLDREAGPYVVVGALVTSDGVEGRVRLT